MALVASLRVASATLLVCSGLYAAIILAIGQALVPASADGQLVEQGGRVVGSRQVAQAFADPRYLWPRPSAVDFNGAGAGGSNLSPANPALAERAREAVLRFGASASNPLPAELATASGSGLDPHISLEAALWQAPRVAAARKAPEAAVRRLITAEAGAVPLLASGPIVNLLDANLALDAAFPLEARGD